MVDSEGLEIRVAGPSDMNEIMSFAFMSCEENGLTNASIEKIANEVWSALNLHFGICAVIGKPEGPIEGAVVLRVVKPWYSDEDILEEKAIFIHPDYRSTRGGRAKKLCEFSKKASQTMNMALISSVMDSKENEGKIRMYERQIGKPGGVIFLYKPSEKN